MIADMHVCVQYDGEQLFLLCFLQRVQIGNIDGISIVRKG
ncbi:unknown [Clostridium clostridioforme CAG:132]|uniref:Uncharacterized protein n=1 Tax=[Clostridium] clostridioforme CAG:132 TaxID=1263065 RepID=R6JJV0_9FIRM|nr:unknown [[Clostridium] clostridioforme CAG:132]